MITCVVFRMLLSLDQVSPSCLHNFAILRRVWCIKPTLPVLSHLLPSSVSYPELQAFLLKYTQCFVFMEGMDSQENQTESRTKWTKGTAISCLAAPESPWSECGVVPLSTSRLLLCLWKLSHVVLCLRPLAKRLAVSLSVCVKLNTSPVSRVKNAASTFQLIRVCRHLTVADKTSTPLNILPIWKLTVIW